MSKMIRDSVCLLGVILIFSGCANNSQSLQSGSYSADGFREKYEDPKKRSTLVRTETPGTRTLSGSNSSNGDNTALYMSLGMLAGTIYGANTQASSGYVSPLTGFSMTK